ncbi:uncharacterized protein ACRADG_005250 [Cochliomyia hominivorax]
MPKAIIEIPPLQIPSEHCNETGNESTTIEFTDRSTDSRNNNYNSQKIADRKIKSVESQSKTNLRRSHGRSQRKLQLKPLLSQQKAKNTLKQKSHIPRALELTPSLSSTSLTTNESLPSPSIIKVETLKEQRIFEGKTSTTSCVVRQKSGLILAFRQRKSISQMDFNHARRQMNFSVPTSTMHLNNNNNNCEDKKSLTSIRCSENMMVAYTKNSFVHKMYNQDNYYVTMSGRDPQMAGMRIFATIMLNAWRKRRDEVKHLMDEVADLKRGAIKAKNQLHVFNTLFRVEQKRNDELNCQLKRSLEDINLTKSSCESLTTTVISLKADKALLEQQLQFKEQEFESLNTVLAQTKSDLFKSMTVQRELQASLSMEQRKIQTLENQKNELINEICELNNEALQKQSDLRKEILEKDNEFSEIIKKRKEEDEQIKALNNRILESNRFATQQLNESKAREERLKQEIDSLESELLNLQKCLEITFGKRLKSVWNNFVAYQDFALQMLHWLTYYILPAMPPPPKMIDIPFRLSFDKALSIVKR